MEKINPSPLDQRIPQIGSKKPQLGPKNAEMHFDDLIGAMRRGELSSLHGQKCGPKRPNSRLRLVPAQLGASKKTTLL